MNKFLKAVLAGSMVLGMGACSSSSDSGSEAGGSSSSGGEDVSVFYYTYGDTYVSSVRSALDKDFQDAGIAFQDYDANNSQTTQTEQIDTAIAKGTKCLVVNVVDTGSADAAKAILQKGEDAGIPVIFFNRSVDEETVTSYDKSVFVGTDYEQAGKMQGDMIGRYVVENFDNMDINGDGEISYIMFKGQQGNLEADARTKYGVENANVILEENGKPDLVFYDSTNSDKFLLDKDGAWSSAQGKELMQTALAKNNEGNNNMIELVIANNDEMALGAIAALQETGYNNEGDTVIPVYGVDAVDAAVDAIAKGSMTGTIKQDAQGMADAIMNLCKNYLDGSDTFNGIDESYVVGTWRVNIPYSEYTGE